MKIIKTLRILKASTEDWPEEIWVSFIDEANENNENIECVDSKSGIYLYVNGKAYTGPWGYGDTPEEAINDFVASLKTKEGGEI